MTINMQIAKIDSTNIANGGGNFNAPNKSNNPSFGFKPIEIKDDGKAWKFFKWAGDDFNSAQQRAVSGVTGLLIQPWFDWNNKRVDEDTRKVSTARITAKIIAGMVTGVSIRWVLIKVAEMCTKTENTEKARVEKAIEAKKTSFKPAKKANEIKAWEQCLLPSKYKNKSFREISKYNKAFGTVAAVGVMLFTNFLIDAPLTTYLTNKFTKAITGKDPSELAKTKAKGGN